jgi:hypothetical protein
MKEWFSEFLRRRQQQDDLAATTQTLTFLFTNAVFNLQVSYDYESWRLETPI